MKTTITSIALLGILLSCANNDSQTNSILNINSVTKIFNPPKEEYKYKTYTPKSELENHYIGFNSPNAINRIAEIENAYFNDSKTGFSKFYGTVWKEYAMENYTDEDSIQIFDYYQSKMQEKDENIQSMDCTIYAVEALKHGLGDKYKAVRNYHRQIYKNQGYAGWSMAYILTKYYDWEAYLIVSETSEEYSSCLTNFKKDKKYHVWKQPDIPIERLYILEKEVSDIDRLLLENEFGWGFSEQGWHTWITRFDTLKECNWIGSPSVVEDPLNFNIPLFLQTKFTDYTDYASHVIVFPPKK